jgi:hypothetical protein
VLCIFRRIELVGSYYAGRLAGRFQILGPHASEGPAGVGRALASVEIAGTRMTAYFLGFGWYDPNGSVSGDTRTAVVNLNGYFPLLG